MTGSSPMSERYRLVFRGEVLEGQHKAVVKQRLGAALKVDGERLDAMFTGKAVVIRKDADTDTAARFQIVFKRAGARLRVMPVEPAAADGPVAHASATAAADSGGPAFGLAPVGARMAPEHAAPPPVNVTIAHLSLAAPGTALSTPRVYAPTAPDVSHLTIAALGSDLQPAAGPMGAPAAMAPTWEVASAGVDLVPRAPPVEPPLELSDIDFELAPPGSLLVDEDEAPPPPAPDTSHLRLQ